MALCRPRTVPHASTRNPLQRKDFEEKSTCDFGTQSLRFAHTHREYTQSPLNAGFLHSTQRFFAGRFVRLDIGHCIKSHICPYHSVGCRVLLIQSFHHYRGREYGNAGKLRKRETGDFIKGSGRRDCRIRGASSEWNGDERPVQHDRRGASVRSHALGRRCDGTMRRRARAIRVATYEDVTFHGRLIISGLSAEGAIVT